MQEVFDEIRSALHTVWNRRWVALGVAWVICVLGWLAIAFIPNSYESRARIYVELEDVLSEQLDISGDGKQAITKVRQTLVSGVNLERVSRATKLGEKVVTDAEMQAAVKSLTESIVSQTGSTGRRATSPTSGKTWRTFCSRARRTAGSAGAGIMPRRTGQKAAAAPALTPSRTSSISITASLRPERRDCVKRRPRAARSSGGSSRRPPCRWTASSGRAASR